MLLREIRVLKNLPQQLLAAKVGCSQKLISDFERGFAKPDKNKKKKLAEILGVEPEMIEWEVNYETISE